jgi:hypothetical protein
MYDRALHYYKITDLWNQTRFNLKWDYSKLILIKKQVI